MKIVKTIGFVIFCLLVMNACGGDTSTANQAVAEDHSGHDHAGHDHAGHDHAGHDHSGHDHDAHDGHDHSGHDHAQAKPERSPEELAKTKEIQERKAKAQNQPPTKQEKATGNQLCTCLKGNSVFAKIKDTKDQAAFDKAAGKSLKEVQALQACHNEIITAAIKDLPKDQQGIYAFRARKHANKSCFGRDNDDLWFMMGKYVATHSNVNKVLPKRTTPIPKGEVIEKAN